VASDPHENLLGYFAGQPGIVAVRCNGHGSVTLEMDDGHPASARCPACATIRLHASIEAFVPPRFRDPVPLPDAIAEWAKRGAKAEGLYLAGPVGTGKTHAAWVTVVAWCITAGVRPRDGYWAEEYQGGGWHGPPVIFARMVDLLDDFRPGGESVQRVRDCQNAALLVIDDLGAEKPSEWTQERLYSVIDHRYANCLPLLVTGNLPPAKIAEQTGDRVASRLAEMCRGRVVPMTGADRRRRS
jgi:DNA replication protein DnaC